MHSSLLYVPLLLYILPQGDAQVSHELTRRTESTLPPESEFVFSPEKKFVNQEEIEQMKQFDARPDHIPPFYSEERVYGTEPPPMKRRWKKVKGYFKKVLFDRFTPTPLPENATRGPGVYKKLYNFIKYTVFKKATPNVSECSPTTEDYFSKYFTNWKHFNDLYFEILNSTYPENHWFYRKIMTEGFPELEDDFETTTILEFDCQRMAGFSTNFSSPPTTMYASEVEAVEIPEFLRDLTLRPGFVKAIDKYVAHIEALPTLPPIVRPCSKKYFYDHPIYKKIHSTLMSFYWITTQNPKWFMLSKEEKRNRKLIRWLATKEKLIQASLEKAMQSYVPDFGPVGNSFYQMLLKITTPRSHIQELMDKQKASTNMNVTVNENVETDYVPKIIQKALAEGRTANMTVLEHFLLENAINQSIPYETSTLSSEPSVQTVNISTRVFTTERTTEGATIPLELEPIISNKNFSINEEMIQKAYDNAINHFPKFSFIKGENFAKYSKMVWEDQFTTPVDYNSSEAHIMMKRYYSTLTE